MKVLVTGAAGFLGSHLVDRLHDAGHDVVALDDPSTGTLANLAHLEGKARFKFVKHDVREAYDFDVERIYNLACPASPPHYQRDAVKTTMTSVLGAFHALTLAEKRGARFFQASTSEVYGDPDVHPQPESYRGNVNPIGPRACYDEGKRCAESLVMDFRRQHGVDTRMARIFNTYGPRMDFADGRVVSNFIVQALRGQDLTVYGDGKQTRSFCYVSDLIDGFVALMEHPTEPGPVNLGNPHEFTMLELAEKVLAATGGRAKLKFEPLPVDDPRQRKPDITKARSVLAFTPRVDLTEGLTKTTAEFRQRLATSASAPATARTS